MNRHTRKLLLIPTIALLLTFLVGFTPIKLGEYDVNTDYLALMKDCAVEGTEASMILGNAYEQIRNLKIDGENLVYAKTHFFDKVSTPEVILQKINAYAETDFEAKAATPDPDVKIKADGQGGIVYVPQETNYDYSGGSYNDYSGNMRSLGRHHVTGYVATGNPCASGKYPYVGCCACNGLPFGTTVYVSGLGYYTVEDRGGMGDSYAIDIFCSSVSECYGLTGTYEIFVVG